MVYREGRRWALAFPVSSLCFSPLLPLGTTCMYSRLTQCPFPESSLQFASTCKVHTVSTRRIPRRRYATHRARYAKLFLGPGRGPLQCRLFAAELQWQPRGKRMACLTGVCATDSQGEIRKAFRRLSLLYHPDRSETRTFPDMNGFTVDCTGDCLRVYWEDTSTCRVSIHVGVFVVARVHLHCTCTTALAEAVYRK